MSHNFLKYAPLRMKLRNIENPSSSGILSNENLVGNSRHFASMFRDAQAQAASHSRAEISNLATHQTLHEENSKEEDDGISIENINIWFQRQERRTSELQIQLDSSITENNRLKISLEKSHKEIQNLQNINKTLQVSQFLG